MSVYHEEIDAGRSREVDCPGNFDGSVLFRCEDGVAVIDYSGSACTRDDAEASSAATWVFIVIGSIAAVLVSVLAIVGYLAFVRRQKQSAVKSATYTSAPPSASTPSAAAGASVGSAPAPASALLGAPTCTNSAAAHLSPVVPPPPSYWSTSNGVHIKPAEEMLPAVQRLMEATWRVAYSRDRKRAAGGADSVEVPTGCQVVNVLRVEHHAVWSKYARYREALRARRRESKGGEGKLEGFKVSTGGLLGGAAGSRDALDPEVNEFYLFHGTSPNAANSIVSDDFRIDLAGSRVGKMYGPGIYLAENSSKSDEYSQPGDGIWTGLHGMLICRAVGGRVNTVTEARDRSTDITSGAYDAICGDRLAAVGTFREFVFFREEAVYTEYVVIYRRVFGAKPGSG